MGGGAKNSEMSLQQWKSLRHFVHHKHLGCDNMELEKNSTSSERGLKPETLFQQPE